jgi:acyl-coenzyme A thioesterase PaaI-like protein
MSDHIAPTVPAGFKPMPMGGSFVAINGPLYVFRQGATAKLGLRIEQRHCNPLGMSHGGMLATFADMLMPVVMYADPELAARRRYLPTVSLQLDFVAPARLGAWIEGEGEILKATRSLVFVHGLVRADGSVVLRCSGVYKFTGEIGAGSPGMYTDDVSLVP